MRWALPADEARVSDNVSYQSLVKICAVALACSSGFFNEEAEETVTDELGMSEKAPAWELQSIVGRAGAFK